MDHVGADAGHEERDDTGPELAAVRRAVHDLLQAQESLIEALSARGMLDARAPGVLAAIDQLKAEIHHTRTAGTRDGHPVEC
jgi:hypothetical protein